MEKGATWLSAFHSLTRPIYAPAAYSDFKHWILIYGDITLGAYDGTSIK